MIQIACPLKRKRIAERKKSDPELRKRLKEFDDYMKLLAIKRKPNRK